MDDQDIFRTDVVHQCISELVAYGIIEFAVAAAEAAPPYAMQLIVDALCQREEGGVRAIDNYPFHGEPKLAHQRDDTWQALGDTAALTRGADDPYCAAGQLRHRHSCG